MHDEVARLHLLQLFHGESHLARACSIAAQAVLMETVEYLMIGKETHVQVVIGESFVQGLIHRLELYVVVASLYLFAVEYVAQTFCLFLAVGKYVELVAHEAIILKRTGEKVEVFVEKRLRSDVEFDGGIRRSSGLMTYFHTSESLGLLRETGSADQLVLTSHVAHYLVLLSLGGSFKPLCDGLRGETVLVYL